MNTYVCRDHVQRVLKGRNDVSATAILNDDEVSFLLNDPSFACLGGGNIRSYQDHNATFLKRSIQTLYIILLHWSVRECVPEAPVNVQC